MPTPVEPSGQSRDLVLAISKFSSSDGSHSVRQCIQKFLPFDPHDYQLEGVCQALDGIDMIAITATGDGKTGYFYMFIIAAIYFSQNPTCCPPGVHFPKDPAIVVVCPTNSIEEQMAEKMTKLGLTAAAINTDTLHKHRQKGIDLWASIVTGVSMIMVSPEQLAGSGFQRLLDNKAFWARVIALGADEIHLLPAWGVLFRKAYQQVVFMRARFPERTVVIGVTATLATGAAFDTVRTMLGMRPGRFHCIRRSNFRPEIQLLMRDLGTGINGRNFPALLWVLDSGRKTVIYCATISLAFRVTSYLWININDRSNLSTRLRMYTALNFPSYNEATRKLLYDDPSSNITVATAAMAQGIDAPDIHDVIIVGEVLDPDEAHQRWGRAGRDRTKVHDARGIMYLTGSAVSKAKTVIKGKSKATKLPGSTKASTPEMTEGMACMILAECLSAEQDRYYGNPRENPPCGCKTCPTSPPPTRSSTCNCSRCIPEDLPPISIMRIVRPSVGDPLHRSLQDTAHARLICLRYEIWREADEYTYGSTPAAAFLPEFTITHILNNISAFQSIDHLRSAIASNHLLVPHVQRLLEALDEIRAIEMPSVDRASRTAEDEDVAMTVEDSSSNQDSAIHLAEPEDGAGGLDVGTSDQHQAEPSRSTLASQREIPQPIDDARASTSRKVADVPAHMCFSWDTGIVTNDQQPSKRRAAKPSSQRKAKKGRVENKENGS